MAAKKTIAKTPIDREALIDDMQLRIKRLESNLQHVDSIVEIHNTKDQHLAKQYISGTVVYK
jgi:ribosomal protein L35AE/L33A